jgi:hypothetical protein
MAGDDRISHLPDDLLQHILYFAPAKEAASTSALARRWRTQWLSSAAVNLDTSSYPGLLYRKRPAFVRDADAALAARGRRWPLRPRSVPVYSEVFGPVLGCFFRARLKHSKTLQNTRGPFGGPDLARLGPRKHPKTRRVGVESKRSTPLAFSSLAARDEEATLSGRRHRRSKTTPAPPLPPTLQGHAAAPSRCPAAAPSHCPAAAPSR